ncbi:S24 family peptidase [Sphingomonas melonis]|uniref:S24 family peptidase n=1 Tax=Sphingomonas melonis TaxID=152682 RepID=UPI0035C7E038
MSSAAINLKALREATHPRMSVRALAEALGMPASSYAFYEDPKKFKKPLLPMELVRALIEPLTANGIPESEVLALGGVGESALPAPAMSSEAAADLLDLVGVASVDMAYGMGLTFADAHVDVQVMHFPRAWIESLTATAPQELAWARGRGNSMSPTIEDNDLVLIDRSDRVVRDQDAIWAFTIGDIAMMKRLRVRGENVTILSDNKNVDPDHAHPDEINIVGRVSHIVRRL